MTTCYPPRASSVGPSIPYGFRISSFCCSGACVEVGLRPDGSAAVRDAKDTARTVTHECPPQAWTEFLAGAGAGEFDLPA